MEKQRTTQQNKSLHKLFGEIATELLNAGVERRTIVEDLDSYSVPIDPSFVKEIWRAIQYSQTLKTSTKDLTTAEIDRVHETFNRFMADNYAIHIPFPSMEALADAFVDENTYL